MNALATASLRALCHIRAASGTSTRGADTAALIAYACGRGHTLINYPLRASHCQSDDSCNTILKCHTPRNIMAMHRSVLYCALYILPLAVTAWSTPKPEPIVSIADHGCLGALSLLERGRGTFFVPPGIWFCPPMNLTSNTVVYLSENSILKADTKLESSLARVEASSQLRHCP